MHCVAHILSKNWNYRYGLIISVQKLLLTKYVPNFCCSYPTHTSTIDTIATLTSDIINKNENKFMVQSTTLNNISESKDINDSDLNQMYLLSSEQIEIIILKSLQQNQNEKIGKIIKKCEITRKILTKNIFHKLIQTFSLNGNVNMMIILKSYCWAVYPSLYIRNGKYNHYLARAQCMKGNSEQGLTLLKESYENNKNIQGICRQILRELINDSVQNRSEASLVVFKKHVLDFSERLKDHYPLLCFWHICWTSSWFSDQMVATELVESSLPLRNIIKDRAPHLCLNVLKNEYNEDAVMKLLQSLLKFDMMIEYAKILQILFGFKLKNGDVRGCKEIIHNCEALGIPLPSSHQSRFIEMIIQKNEPPTKNFRLKF